MESKQDEPYYVVACSLVRDMSRSFEEFQEEVTDYLASLPEDTALAVFPEYCWRTTPAEQVLDFVRGRVKESVSPDLVLVLGTVDTVLPGSPPNARPTNTALVLGEGRLQFVPKTKVLAADRLNGVVAGTNPGVLAFRRFRLAVLVCADLWDVQLCYDLAHVQNADVFAVPAWTATRRGNRGRAREYWHALANVRCKEYGIVVAVADHARNFQHSDVANATWVFHPSEGCERPDTDPVEECRVRIKPAKLRESVTRWNSKGLGQ